MYFYRVHIWTVWKSLLFSRHSGTFCLIKFLHLGNNRKLKNCTLGTSLLYKLSRFGSGTFKVSMYLLHIPSQRVFNTEWHQDTKFWKQQNWTHYKTVILWKHGGRWRKIFTLQGWSTGIKKERKDNSEGIFWFWWWLVLMHWLSSVIFNYLW